MSSQRDVCGPKTGSSSRLTGSSLGLTLQEWTIGFLLLLGVSPKLNSLVCHMPLLCALHLWLKDPNKVYSNLPNVLGAHYPPCGLHATEPRMAEWYPV